MLEMVRRKSARLMLIAAFLSLVSKSSSQYRSAPVVQFPSYPAPTVQFPSYPAVRPLCVSQFTLVNHACSLLPYSPVSPPSPPPPPCSPTPGTPCTPPNSHRHHHRHHRHPGGSPDAASEECCRWLREVDTQCVCDLLVRLPVFLAKPAHEYSVTVTPDCTVSYKCPGRVIMS